MMKASSPVEARPRPEPMQKVGIVETQRLVIGYM